MHSRKTRAIAFGLLCCLGLLVLARPQAQAYINAGFRNKSDYYTYQRYRNQVVAKIGPLSAAIKRDPKDAVAYYQRARAWEELPGYNGPCPDRTPELALDKSYQALEDYGRAIALDPSLTKAYFRRASLLWASKKYQRAIKDLQQAARLKPKWALAQASLAFAYADCPEQKYRNEARALAHAKRACQASKNADAAALQVLAARYARAKDFKAAVKWQAKAVAVLKDRRSSSHAGHRLGAYKKAKGNPVPFTFWELEEASKGRSL
jgi:tetratricopeptide (TPR) repeat protein